LFFLETYDIIYSESAPSNENEGEKL